MKRTSISDLPQPVVLRLCSEFECMIGEVPGVFHYVGNGRGMGRSFAEKCNARGVGVSAKPGAAWCPRHCDSDDDGLPDGIEIAFGSDPNVADTDGDGLSDAEEHALGTEPKCADTDGDGLNDSDEKAMDCDPDSPDSDGDFLHFSTQDTGIKSGDTEAVLTGRLRDGTNIGGTGSVNTIPPEEIRS